MTNTLQSTLYSRPEGSEYAFTVSYIPNRQLMPINLVNNNNNDRIIFNPVHSAICSSSHYVWHGTKLN